MISTYGDVAKALGYPSAARTIGNILNKNPDPVVVPCHRIVKSNGNIGDYVSGMLKKRELLEEEGIKFQNENLIDFNICRINFKEIKYK